jgi:hypothetical protein
MRGLKLEAYPPQWSRGNCSQARGRLDHFLVTTVGIFTASHEATVLLTTTSNAWIHLTIWRNGFHLRCGLVLFVRFCLLVYRLVMFLLIDGRGWFVEGYIWDVESYWQNRLVICDQIFIVIDGETELRKEGLRCGRKISASFCLLRLLLMLSVANDMGKV